MTNWEHGNCLKIFQGFEHKEGKSVWCLKEKTWIPEASCSVVFLCNPIGFENLIVLQHSGRNFLIRKHTVF